MHNRENSLEETKLEGGGRSLSWAFHFEQAMTKSGILLSKIYLDTSYLFFTSINYSSWNPDLRLNNKK